MVSRKKIPAKRLQPQKSYSTLFLSVPPLVTVDPKQKKVEAGKNATFVCSASGNPSPDIVWTRGGNEVQEGNVLHFEAASLDNESYYTCSAENEEGTDVASVWLDVFGK